MHLNKLSKTVILRTFLKCVLCEIEYLIVRLGDVNGTKLLIEYCAIDLKEIRDPWPLHLASAKGNLLILKNKNKFQVNL